MFCLVSLSSVGRLALISQIAFHISLVNPGYEFLMVMMHFGELSMGQDLVVSMRICTKIEHEWVMLSHFVGVWQSCK